MVSGENSGPATAGSYTIIAQRRSRARIRAAIRALIWIMFHVFSLHEFAVHQHTLLEILSASIELSV